MSNVEYWPYGSPRFNGNPVHVHVTNDGGHPPDRLRDADGRGTNCDTKLCYVADKVILRLPIIKQLMMSAKNVTARCHTWRFAEPKLDLDTLGRWSAKDSYVSHEKVMLPSNEGCVEIIGSMTPSSSLC